MKSLKMLFCLALVAACGSSTPDVLRAILAEEQVTLQAGESKAYPFTVDVNTQIEPAVLVGIGTTEPGLEVGVLVIRQANFAAWDAGEEFTPRYETSTEGSNISVLIEQSDNYRLIVSNRDGEQEVTYGIQADLFWQAE